jgi:peptidoglycan-associated lipoprotein
MLSALSSIRQTSKQATKVAALAVLASSVVFATGCANKRTGTSEVVVAPLGIPGGQGLYTGGAIVSNSGAIIDAAQNIQATVYFDFDRSDISSEAAAVLNQHAALLASNPSASVLVAGHTDERGSREYNMALGERRAQAVRTYLASQGVTGGNVQVISYGEERPIATGNNEQSYQQNRRAELSY